MTEKENRILEVSAFIAATAFNFWFFGWYLSFLAAFAMIISDSIVNNINSNNND